MTEIEETTRRWLAREWREASEEWLHARREYARLQSAEGACDAARLLQARCRLDYADWRRRRLAAQYDVQDSLFAVTSQRVSTR